MRQSQTFHDSKYSANDIALVYRAVTEIIMPKVSTSYKPGQSGNPKGKPSGARDRFNLLMDAIKRVEKKKGISLWEHFIETAFSDTTVLVSVMRKLVPDMKHVEGEFGERAVQNFEQMMRAIYGNGKGNGKGG